MKFIIFANNTHNYVKPIADGLAKTLTEEGHQTHVWYDGIHWLSNLNLIKVLLIDIYRFFSNILAGNKDKYIYRFWGLLTFNSKKRRALLSACDCIIVVNNCPTVFYGDKLTRIEELRTRYNKPIVNYDFHYLPNQAWYKRILDTPKPFGLERFDWYLPIGLVTEYAIPREIPKIYSCIGMDIKADNLYPEQKQFRALIDFPRKGYEEYTSLVKKVLSELNIQYIELNGLYTRDEIRTIYRQSSIYFVSCRESFGLPICELQLCGCYIFTPKKEWCPAHYLNKSPYTYGDGDLGENYIVYNNDRELLRKEILDIKSEFKSDKTIDNFKADYPDYFEINRNELLDFISKLDSGEITAESHSQYANYNKYISLDDDISSQLPH